jgi:hypothetical protein
MHTYIRDPEQDMVQHNPPPYHFIIPPLPQGIIGVALGRHLKP